MMYSTEVMYWKALMEDNVNSIFGFMTVCNFGSRTSLKDSLCSMYVTNL